MNIEIVNNLQLQKPNYFNSLVFLL